MDNLIKSEDMKIMLFNKKDVDIEKLRECVICIRLNDDKKTFSIEKNRLTGIKEDNVGIDMLERILCSRED